MRKKKIISIAGARPQFVKLAPISRILKKEYNHVIVHTGQHYDKNMSDFFFKDLKIPDPKYHLGIGSLSQAGQTALMMVEIEKTLLTEKPLLVIVYGDTNSTLAGSLAAAKLNIKSVHVEAGLRSFNRSMPEEINRIVSDHTSDYLFAPTANAVMNLKNEGLIEKTFLTGDIMTDSINESINISKKNSDVLKKINSDNYYLLTLHRPYNVDDIDNLEIILRELDRIGKEIIFPFHPRTQKILNNRKQVRFRNIKFFPPFGYLDFLVLQKNAQKIITDSGGIQKEAYILKKPCITLRSETEWIETVETGWNMLINPHTENNFSKKIESFHPGNKQKNIFGKNAAEKMLKIINEIVDKI